LYSASTRSVSEALRYCTHYQGVSQFYLHTLRIIRKRNEPYLPLPSQPQLVLICRPRRDGSLSRHWCEVALVTGNLPIAYPALYHTATIAPNLFFSFNFSLFTGQFNSSHSKVVNFSSKLDLWDPST